MKLTDIQEIYSDNVLIKLHDAPKITEGGIHIPDSANAFPKSKATVIKHGEGFRDTNTGRFKKIIVSVGDTVSLSSHNCNELTEWIIDDEKYYLVREVDIDCIMDDFEDKFSNIGIFIPSEVAFESKIKDII